MKGNSRWVIYTKKDRLTCPCCGEDVEIFTNMIKNDIDIGFYFDGDPVRCLDKTCPMINGQVVCDESHAYLDGEF